MSSQPGPGPGPGARSPAGGMLGPIVSLAVVAVLQVWVAGVAAALLTHGRLLHTHPDELGAITLHLLSHPGDPASAWPPADQRLLPGPVGFYLSFTFTLATVAGAAVGGWRLWNQHSGSLTGRDGYGATWASRRDLRDLFVRPHTSLTGRIVLGRTSTSTSTGRLRPTTIATTLRHSLLLFGPTLSGKTTSFVIPTILRWRGPVVATSSKVDMLLATLEPRRRRGQVHILDPFGASGLPSIRWSPLVGSTTWADALDMAYWLTQAASLSHNLQNAEFWETLAKNLLGPLLYAAANKPGGTMLDVVAWASDYERADDVFQLFAAMRRQHPDDRDPELAHSALAACVQADPRRKDSIYGTAQVLLDVYRYPDVAATASGCDIDRDNFLAGYDEGGNPVDNTFFVFSPEHRQDQLRPLFEACICWLIRGAEDRYALTGLALHPPLLVMLDEAANIAPLRKLGTYASSLASQGVQLVAVFQNFGQIKDRYGTAANTIVTNFLVKVLMGATTDRDLLDLLTYLLGKEEIAQPSVTHNLDGSRTTTTNLRQRDLAPIHRLVQQRPGHALALLSHHKPVRLRVRPYTDLPEFHSPAGWPRLTARLTAWTRLARPLRRLIRRT